METKENVPGVVNEIEPRHVNTQKKKENKAIIQKFMLLMIMRKNTKLASSDALIGTKKIFRLLVTTHVELIHYFAFGVFQK